MKNWMPILALFFMLTTAEAALAQANNLAICVPSNTLNSGEPLVVLASGEIAHLTWMQAHLPEPDQVRQYPVSDLREVLVGSLSDLALQVPSSVTAKLLPKKGKLTVLAMDHSMTPTDTAYELLEMAVEAQLSYPDGRKLLLQATIPAGSHPVSWSFSEQGPGYAYSGLIETHCEMRKSFVR